MLFNPALFLAFFAPHFKAMLNRRILRIKAMQALYAFFSSGNTDLRSGEVELNRNLSKFYELYLILLSITSDLIYYTSERLEEGKKKQLATSEDLTPNTWFLNNSIAKTLLESQELQKELARLKINTRTETDLLHKIYQNVRGSERYQAYIKAMDDSQSIEFFCYVFKEFIANEPTLSFFLEEQNIYFLNDLDHVAYLVLKTLKSWEIGIAPSKQRLLPLYKDEEDDRKFVLELFRFTILHKQEYEALISSYTPNWETERLAQMDMLLMEMAVCEFLNFPSIPVNVSMNEYIEISKEYSTAQSKTFINGVLDKILKTLNQEKKIKKAGRGLMQ